MKKSLIATMLFLTVFAFAATVGKDDKKKNNPPAKKEDTSSKQQVCLTKEEAQELYDRLDKDGNTIKWQADRWSNLVNSKPTITWKIVDDKVVIEKVEFAVPKDKPLTYNVTVEIDTVPKKLTFFPFKINLGLFAESGIKQVRTNTLGQPVKTFYITDYVDPKIGLQFLGFEPINIPFINRLGLHALVGLKSAGFSLSMNFPKPVENTRIHFYVGMSYKIKATFGGGITLNF